MVANLHLQWTNQIFNLYLNGCWLKMSSWGRGLSSWGRRSEWRANSRPIHSPPPPLPTSPPLSMYSLVLSLSALSSQFTLLPISSPRSPLPLNCWALPASILTLSLSFHIDWELGTSKFASRRPLLRPHFFVSSPLKQISRSSKTKPWQWGESRPGKEIVLITAENGKQSEMSRPVLTILKYYKLQLQMSRREQWPLYKYQRYNTNSDKHTHACGHSVYHFSLVSLWAKSTQYVEPKM